MSDHVVVREARDDNSKGRDGIRYVGAEAELTWSALSPTRIMADHTAVPDAMRGTGAGLAMVKQMLTDARAERVTVIPLCPFVTVQAKRHFEWVGGFSG